MCTYYCSQLRYAVFADNGFDMIFLLIFKTTSFAQISVRITWKPEFAGPLTYFRYSIGPIIANAVVEYLGTEGPHTYFSVIQLMAQMRSPVQTTV